MIILGHAVQILHLIATFAIWYVIGRISSLWFLGLVLLSFPFFWLLLGGCPLTTLANSCFRRAGVETHHNLYEWARTIIGPRWALFVLTIPIVGYLFGAIMTGHMPISIFD